jgi:hypothetical protein
MAHALRRKTGDDALYGCGLCAFLDASWMAAERAAETLRAVEDHVAILRRAARALQAPTAEQDPAGPQDLRREIIRVSLA